VKNTLMSIILSAISVGATESALSGKEILDQMKKATVAKDRQVLATMTITDRNGRIQTRTMDLMTKGDKKILVTFTSPAELRGVTFMTTSSENMWIYLPAQARVRRISGSMVNQSFGGSDFSYKEMTNISYALDDKVEKVEKVTFKEKPTYLLTLSEANNPNQHSKLWVEKENFLPLQLEKFDKNGEIIKRVIFNDFVQEGSVWIPKLIQMQDLTKNSRTEIKVTEFQLNTGIKDNMFTESNMKRGG